MRTIYTIALILLGVTVSAQQNAEEILASNEVNTGKAQHTLLASEFNQLSSSKLDGTYKILAENGNLKEIRSFKEGALDGTWLEYDENQNLVALANYKNNKKHGKWVIWDENGVKRYELFYENGNRTGNWKSWDESGKLTSEKQY